MHVLKRTLAMLVLVSLAVTTLPSPTPAQTEKGSRFTIGVLPDTQFYARYSTPETGNLFNAQYGSEPYAAQTQWLVDNDEQLNMPFVAHLGDVVDQYTVREEWIVADEAMKILEDGGLPYSILAGNHDIKRDDLDSHTSMDTYIEWFPESRSQSQATFEARQPGRTAEAHIFEAEGQEYLVLALPFWYPAYETYNRDYAWAQSVIDSHPGIPTILTTHELMTMNGDHTGIEYDSDYWANQIWQNLVRNNDQIFMTLCGHNHGAGYMIDQNDAGHDVINILQDYQMAYQGGNGLLGVLEFDLTDNEVSMTALSPWVPMKPAETLNVYDEVILEGPQDSYTVEGFDLVARLAQIVESDGDDTTNFAVGDGQFVDLSQLARDIVTEGYVPPTVDNSDLPADENDYVHVDGTVAHWRPGHATVSGQPVADGDDLPIDTSVIPDIAGDSPLTRADDLLPLGAQNGSAHFSTDHHPLSADAGSVCFPDATRNPANGGGEVMDYFVGPDDAAVNSMTFENGYTMEAFVKIDDDWTKDNNRWMGALTRSGNRAGTYPGISEGSEPVAALAFSSIAEMQWTNVASVGEGNLWNDGWTNWSHEIPLDEWQHVAVVSDPETMSTVMYVNGAPILRNIFNSAGLATVDQPWLMGANWWDGSITHGWFGCIGEARIVNHPLEQSEWLTTRAVRPITTNRVEGPARVETAVEVSKLRDAGSADSVILASSQNFPDALAGIPLAHQLDAPILLTPPEALPAAVLAEIDRVGTDDVTVVVLGGTSAVPDVVTQAVSDAGHRVDRIAGATRVETALEIADRINDPLLILIADGYKFPDSLTAGPAASANNGVLVLTDGETVPDSLATYLADHADVEQAAIGGTAARALPSLQKIAGATRVETAVQVAQLMFTNPQMVGVASSQNWPDALAGGADVARSESPILLTDPEGLHPSVRTYLADHASITEARLYGGEAALNAQVVTDIVAVPR